MTFGLRAGGRSLVGGDRVAVVEVAWVDLEGRRGTRLQQTKAATLPAGRLLVTLLRVSGRDSHQGGCVCEGEVATSPLRD